MEEIKPTISGIYKITNKLNGKIYIGSSKNIPKRWKHHLYMLRANNHYNKHFQSAWNKYGGDNFVFEVIEYIPENELEYAENCYLDLATKIPELYYNLANNARSPMRGRSVSLETKLKMSNAQKGERSHKFGKHISTEHKMKISNAVKGEKHPMFNKKHTPQAREKISNAGRGRNHSPETRAKMSKSRSGANNPMFGKTGEKSHMYGRKRSPEITQRILETKRLRGLIKPKTKYNTT